MQQAGKHIVLFIACLYFTALASAQVTGTKVFSISDESSSPKILCLQKHSKGYLLAGTTDGLYRFNGTGFFNYKITDTVKRKSVSAVAEDNQHTVWIGFQTGEIGFVSNDSVKILYAEEGHPAVAITCILPDNKGTVYFATAGEGIYYYRNKRFYNINTDDGLSDNYIYQLQLSGTNSVIAGTDQGVNICTINQGKKNIVSYKSNTGIPDNIVRSLIPYSNNTFLLGMQDKGIGLFDVASHTYKPYSDYTEWPFAQVNSILKSHAGVWVGTETNGLISVNDTNATEVNFSYNQHFSKVSHLLNDDEGNVWFTSSQQLVKTSGYQLRNIIPYAPDLFSRVNTILADRNKNIWISSNNRLKQFHPEENTWQVKDYNFHFFDIKTDITSLYQDKFGNIWIGSMGKGIIVLNPSTGKSRSITENPLLLRGSILSINGRDDQIWISSLSGAVLCTLHNENADVDKPYTFKNFSNVSGVGSNYIYSIMVDSKGRAWFATDGKGLTLYENGTFTNYNKKEGLKNPVVYSLCEDTAGNIWLSTLNGGLYKFDGIQFTNFSAEQGLNDRTITALAVDRKGNIVAISKKGINIVDPRTGYISYLDADQGITELNGALNCIATTISGHVLLSSAEGIIDYYPDYLSLKPKIVLESIQLFLKDIGSTAQSSFNYDENNISFTYSGISMSHPFKIKYQYRLEGFSNEWVSTVDNNINFPRLPPGAYTFRVRASLNSNFSNSDEAVYRFTIKKPLWLQWWFIACCLLWVLAFLLWFIKNRERRLKRWERLEKERIQSQFETLKSQVNPHFLFNSFNTLISVIEENPGKAVEYVEHLSDLYRKIVTYRDKDLILLKEETDLINDYFFIQQKRFGNNLRLNVQLSDEDLSGNLIAPLTLQLLAENAVKHNAVSAETPLTIDIFINNKMLVVKNNVNPKLTTEKGSGMGLQNIQNRYKLLGSEDVKIEKTATLFIVCIPLIKPK